MFDHKLSRAMGRGISFVFQRIWVSVCQLDMPGDQLVSFYVAISEKK